MIIKATFGQMSAEWSTAAGEWSGHPLMVDALVAETERVSGGVESVPRSAVDRLAEDLPDMVVEVEAQDEDTAPPPAGAIP
jgi:hypothetical protein